MLIRSQNRMDLVNLDTVSNVYVEDTNIYCSYPDDVIRIGEYNTEAEAVLVLDMIQEHYLMYYASSFQEMIPYPKVFLMPETVAAPEIE